MIAINTSPGTDDNIADDNLHHVAAHGFELCEPHSARVFGSQRLDRPGRQRLTPPGKELRRREFVRPRDRRYIRARRKRLLDDPGLQIRRPCPVRSRRAAIQALDIRLYQLKATGSGYSFAHIILLKQIIQENLILPPQPRYVGTPTRLRSTRQRGSISPGLSRTC